MGRRLACLVAAAALLLAVTAAASDLSTLVPTRVKIQVHIPRALYLFLPLLKARRPARLMLNFMSHLAYWSCFDRSDRLSAKR